MRRLLLLVVAAGFTVTADARYVYRTDDGGVPRYSDLPTPGSTRVWIPDEDRVAAPDDETGAPASEGEGAEDADDAEDAESAEAAADGDAESPELRAKLCAQKKDQLKQYQNSTSIVERDHLGKEREYTPAERRKLLAATAAQVKEYCEPPTP